jgi:hypothetical protein
MTVTVVERVFGDHNVTGTLNLLEAAVAAGHDRFPLPQQRHLQPAAAVDRMVGENPVEPLQKLEFLGRFRPRPVI